MSKTTILLIRHGQTDWNASKRSQGHLDIPLNHTGRRQSQLLARRLLGWPISALYSSDLQRASETAAIIGRQLGLAPVLEPALRERHGGIFQGLTGQEAQQRHPQALQEFLAYGRPLPGGETNLDLARRATPVLERIMAEHRHQTVALVTHGGTLRVLIAYILGLPLGRNPPVKVSYNTGLTIVDVSQQGRVISLLNDSCHLETEAKQDGDPPAAGMAGGEDGYAIG
jgi:broad specificity phosphatase PhoE